MLMIRLQRVGRKHEPVFRIVLTDSKNGPKSGKFLEILGSYDARKEDRGKFKLERIQHWISKGAQLSDTVHNFLVDKKAIEGKKVNVLPKKRPVVIPTPSEAEVGAPTVSVGEEDAYTNSATEEEVPESEVKPEIKEEEEKEVAEEKAV